MYRAMAAADTWDEAQRIYTDRTRMLFEQASGDAAHQHGDHTHTHEIVPQQGLN